MAVAKASSFVERVNHTEKRREIFSGPVFARGYRRKIIGTLAMLRSIYHRPQVTSFVHMCRRFPSKCPHTYIHIYVYIYIYRYTIYFQHCLFHPKYCMVFISRNCLFHPCFSLEATVILCMGVSGNRVNPKNAIAKGKIWGFPKMEAPQNG